jgi:MFS family permease
MENPVVQQPVGTSEKPVDKGNKVVETRLPQTTSVFDQLLVADFNQCFLQLREHDHAFGRLIQFGFLIVVTIGGAAGSLIARYGRKEAAFTLIGVLLGLACITIFTLIMMAARERVYFTFVCRFINEIRACYLTQMPAGMTNRTGFYTDHTAPKVADAASTHMLQIYLLAFFNAILFSGALSILPMVGMGIARRVLLLNLWTNLFAGVMFLAVQILGVRHYWKSKEESHKAEIVFEPEY